MSIAIQSQSKELGNFSNEQATLLKNYLCKGITDDEIKLFSAVCKKTGLDPFMKQIYAVKRKDQMTIQTSIDGYRLIAERTGKYAPGRESAFVYDQEGKLVSATSYVKKQTADGTWHEVAATAFYDEYKPAYSNAFWETKKHIMLAKCAEALVLRKAFPNELSQIYTDEEMLQASNSSNTHQACAVECVSDEQYEELSSMLLKCSPEDQVKFNEWMTKRKMNSLQELPKNMFSMVKETISKKILDNPVEVANGTEHS